MKKSPSPKKMVFHKVPKIGLLNIIIVLSIPIPLLVGKHKYMHGQPLHNTSICLTNHVLHQAPGQPASFGLYYGNPF